MMIPVLKAPKTSAPPPAAHIIVARRDFAQYFLPHQKILRTALMDSIGFHAVGFFGTKERR